jgi:hypothetical protein
MIATTDAITTDAWNTASAPWLCTKNTLKHTSHSSYIYTLHPGTCCVTLSLFTELFTEDLIIQPSECQLINPTLAYLHQTTSIYNHIDQTHTEHLPGCIVLRNKTTTVCTGRVYTSTMASKTHLRSYAAYCTMDNIAYIHYSLTGLDFLATI